MQRSSTKPLFFGYHTCCEKSVEILEKKGLPAGHDLKVRFLNGREHIVKGGWSGISPEQVLSSGVDLMAREKTAPCCINLMHDDSFTGRMKRIFK